MLEFYEDSCRHIKIRIDIRFYVGKVYENIEYMVNSYAFKA